MLKAKRTPCVDGVAACPCGFSRPCAGVTFHVCRPAGRGLGDVVAAGLAAVGITEERVSRLIRRPCGCKKRREALNRLLPDVLGGLGRPAR